MSILEVRELSKAYGDIKAVDGLNLTVNEGDIYGLLGVNGSGKSTTIRIMLTLIAPDRGEIRIMGKELKKNARKIKKRIGALIERPDFYSFLTAYKNLEILMKYSGLDPDSKRIKEVLELVGLIKFMNKKVGIFSQGMKQRLGIAQAMVHDPELIILDEPANGLDPHGLVDIRNLIIKLNHEFNKTIILSSHILKEVEMIANRMIVIHEGKRIKEGTVDELLTSHESKVQISVSDNTMALSMLRETRFSDHVYLDSNGKLICKIKKEDVPEVNKLLVHENIDVYGILPIKNLEEYFISLT